MKQSILRILLDSPLLGWFSAYLRNLTRAQVLVFAHQEMVSVPQSRLTDLPRRETFLSLPFPPPLPLSISYSKGFLPPQRVPWKSGYAWLPLENGRPSVQLLLVTRSQALLGREEARGKCGVSHGWISCGKGSLCVLSFSAPQGPGRGLGSPIKGTGLKPKLDFSLCRSGQELPVLKVPFLSAETDREG